MNNYQKNINVDTLYFLEKLYIFDSWFLFKSRRFLEFVVELLFPIFKFLLIMALGAGLLMICTMNQIKRNHIKSHESNCENSQSIRKYLAAHRDFNQDSINLKKYIPLPKSGKNLILENFNNQDKNTDTDLADFASEIVGGTILDTPGTQSFYKPTPNELKIFGIPIWKPHYYTPRKVIQPWRETGECWAFRGSHGKIEIELAHTVIIDKVTLEHIPKSLSLSGNINSAPKLFNILGKVKNQYIMIDTFVYKEDGLPSQTFQITKRELKNTPLKIIILEILSNYGNSDYTCVYRFKVHGKIHNLLDHKNNMRVH